MPIESVYSQAGKVVLTTNSGSIVDALHTDFEKVKGNNIVLTAGGAGATIGTATDYLETGTTSGSLAATADGLIRLHEVDRSMPVASIVSGSGDVDLKADGSILDYNRTDDVDVAGNNITLTSVLGGIGDYSTDAVHNDLDIDTSHSAQGVLTISSLLSDHIIELSGDLYLNTVAALGAGAIAFIDAPQRILNGNTTPNGSNVTSGKTYLFAGSDIGEAANPLITKVGFMEGLSVGGSVRIDNFGDLEVGGVTGGGFVSEGSLNISANSPILVNSDIVGADVTLQANDDSPDDTITVANGFKVQALTGDACLLAGDDVAIQAGGKVIAAGNIDIEGDYGDLDQLAADIAIAGTVTAGGAITVIGSPYADTFEISGTFTAAAGILFDGGAGDDDIAFYQPVLTGAVDIHGGAGDDYILMDALQSYAGTMLIDGQGGSDAVDIVTTDIDLDGATPTNYVITVHDSGAQTDGVDTLAVEGRGMAGEPATDPDDIFLVRANFIARLHGNLIADAYLPQFERINYDSSINGGVRINGWDGDDNFILDDTGTVLTLDGGTGNDTFQVGQVYGENPNLPSDLDSVTGRYKSGVALGDEIAGTDVSRGFLSNGISNATVLYGGIGDDTFSVYSNKAFLRMEGEDGNDHFIVRAFIATDQIALNGGGGDDQIEYNINAPLSINGGAGFDTVTILGTEDNDSFVITADGVFGAGLNVSLSGVEEAVEVDGLEGDDTFYVLSSRADTLTTLIGGLGSDSFVMGGDVTNTIISADQGAVSGVVTHAVRSDDPAYDALLTDGLAVSLAAPAARSAIAMTNTSDKSVVEDSGDFDSYNIAMALPAADVPDGTIVTITVVAAVSSSQDEALALKTGGTTKARSVGVSLNSAGGYQDAITVTFIKGGPNGNWGTTQTVYVQALHDDALEGAETAVISHGIVVTSPDMNNAAVKAIAATKPDSVLVDVADDDAGGVIVAPTNNSNLVVEGQPGAGQQTDSYTVRLASRPTGTVTVTLAVDPDQIALSSTMLTFDSTNWSQAQTVTIAAVNDQTIEDRITTDISYAVSSSDALYNNLPVDKTQVTVVDGNEAGVLIQPSGGTTAIGAGDPANGISAVTDDYTMRLTSAPTADVTVAISTDGSSDAVLGGRVSLETLASVSAVVSSSTVNGLGTLTRTDGVDWADLGFRVGGLVQVGGGPAFDTSGSATYKIQSLSDGVMTFTASAVLAAQNNVGATIRSVAPSVTFTAADWYQTVDITLAADQSFQPAPGSQFVKLFAPASHTVSPLQGPVVVEGGPGEEDRSLKLAVMLPTETPQPPIDLPLVTDESTKTDTLVVHDDGAQADQAVNVTTDNIAGLGMGTGSVVIAAATNEPAETVAPGITYHGVEVVNLEMGRGNDAIHVDDTPVSAAGSFTFNHDAVFGLDTIQRSSGDWFKEGYRIGDEVTVTGGPDAGVYYVRAISSEGDTLTVTGRNALADAANVASTVTIALPLTVIQGGGNREVSPGVMGGDDIIVTGSATGSIPLVVLGDTSQNGEPYTLPPGIESDLAAGFGHAGNDTIDASGTTAGVVIYGGAGDDRILGGAGNDQIFGGSGNDTIDGGAGDDHISGDDGLNVDYSVRADLSPQTLFVVDGAGAIAAASGDVLTAGADTIDGGAGDNIIIGDYGFITEARANPNQDPRLLSTANVIEVQSTSIGFGAPDSIDAGTGSSIVLGGFGADTIAIGTGNSLVAGDNADVHIAGGLVTAVTATDTGEATGGNDTIVTGSGNNVVLGGVGMDTIALGSGDNIVLGDNGNASFADGVLTYATTADVALGGADTVTGTGGNNIVLGGTGADKIATGGGNDVIIGDDGNIAFSAGMLSLVRTSDPGFGGADIIDAGGGNNIVLGGFGNDSIATGNGNDTVVGDNGKVTLVSGIRNTVTSTDADSSTAGDDNISLGAGQDQAIGGYGSDTILHVSGEAILIGDDGTIVSDAAGRATVSYTGNPMLGGNDTITGGSDRDVIFGGAGADDLVGNDGNDIIIGDAGKVIRVPGHLTVEATDFFIGGNDTLDGGAGNNYMIGGFGDDLFYGSLTKDIMIGEYARIQFQVSADESVEKVISIVTLAQGELDFIRVAMDDIYRNAGGSIPPLPPMLGFTAAQYNDTTLPPVLPESDYDAFWDKFEQIALTDAEWESAATTLISGIAPNSFFGDAAAHSSAAMLALLEQRARVAADPARQQTAAGSRPVQQPAAAVQEAWSPAKAAGGGLLGGLFFWAASRKAEKGESETIARDKLAGLDEKLRRRRYKNWDDVMHG